METLDRIARLPLRQMYSGHGPIIETPLASIDAARRRYEHWLNFPEKLGWHACKRIFAYALTIKGDLTEEEVSNLLLASPWFHDYSRYLFGYEPADFIKPLLAEMVRSHAAAWQEERLRVQTPHNPPGDHWTSGPVQPRSWI